MIPFKLIGSGKCFDILLPSVPKATAWHLSRGERVQVGPGHKFPDFLLGDYRVEIPQGEFADGGGPIDMDETYDLYGAAIRVLGVRVVDQSPDHIRFYGTYLA